MGVIQNPTEQALIALETDPEFRRLRDESLKDGFQRYYILGKREDGWDIVPVLPFGITPPHAANNLSTGG